MKKVIFRLLYTGLIILVCFIISKYQETAQYGIAEIKDSKDIRAKDAILQYNGKDYIKFNLQDMEYISGSMIGNVRTNSYEDYLPSMFKTSVYKCDNDSFMDFIKVTSYFHDTYLFVSENTANRMEQNGFLKQNDKTPNWDKAIPTTVRVNNWSITAKNDIEFLLSLEHGDGKNVKFKIENLDSYVMNVYYNDTPIYKFISNINVVNDVYIYQTHFMNGYTYGKIIKDENKLESIKVDGNQIFTKDIGTTIDGLEYLD